MRQGRALAWLIVAGLLAACGRTEGGVADAQNADADGSEADITTSSGGTSGGSATPAHAGRVTTTTPVATPDSPNSGGASDGESAGDPTTPDAGAPFLSFGGDSDGSGVTGQAGSASGDNPCHFEYLGDWIRCEGDDDYPWSRDIPNQSLVDCTQACLADVQCVGVVDYYWLNLPALGCLLDVSSCRQPGPNAWAEEDHGKEYRKVCN